MSYSNKNINQKGIGQSSALVSITKIGKQGGGGVSKKETVKVQCANFFKNSDNIGDSLNYLWADLINFHRNQKIVPAGLEFESETEYNKNVQSCFCPEKGVKQ